jgi:hypothetical protein
MSMLLQCVITRRAIEDHLYMNFDAEKMLHLTNKWVHDYLYHNGCDLTLSVTCTDGRNAEISSGVEEDNFYIDMYPMQRMPQGEARLYIWGVVARRDIISIANKAVIERLNNAEDEYFEILDAQAIAEGKDPGEIQQLD